MEKIGHIVAETENDIIVSGDHDLRLDIPKSKINSVGKNVILNMTWGEFMRYKVEENTSLPTEQ